MGSSWIRDQSCVSCIGRWILYHSATREDLPLLSDISMSVSSEFWIFPWPKQNSWFPATSLTPRTVVSSSMSGTTITPVVQAKSRGGHSRFLSFLQPPPSASWKVWLILGPKHAKHVYFLPSPQIPPHLELSSFFTCPPFPPWQPMWYSKHTNQIEKLLFLKPFNDFPSQSKSDPGLSGLTSFCTKLAPVYLWLHLILLACFIFSQSLWPSLCFLTMLNSFLD